MLVVGLTGNIGSGKSIIAEMFSVLGVPVYNADNNAKKFLENNKVKALIKENFGEKVFRQSLPNTEKLTTNNEIIDRKAIAEIVFNNPDKLNKLNSIIHPFVIDHFNNWVKPQLSTNYVIIEAAILFETGYNSITDKIIVVTCPEELRIKRIMKRDNMSETEVRHRMKNQWDEEQKVKLADFIIINDNVQLIIPQVLEIRKQLNDINVIK